MRFAAVFMASVALVGLAPAIASSEAPVVEKSADQPAEKDWLKGLREAGPGDLDPSQPIKLDPASIPVYLEDGTRLTGEEFMKMMMSGEYLPRPFIDDSKEVKAFVLRAATEHEKKMMQTMGGPSPVKSELVGKKAKSFTVKDIRNQRYSLKQLKGKVVVVNFWFVECAPCVQEIPDLNKLVDEYTDDGVVFLGLANNDKATLESFLRRHEFKYAVAPGCTSIAADYGVAGYPTHMIIGKDLKIAYFSSGYMPTTVNVLKGALEKLLVR